MMPAGKDPLARLGTEQTAASEHPSARYSVDFLLSRVFDTNTHVNIFISQFEGICTK
jgi:hypothetical protein